MNASDANSSPKNYACYKFLCIDGCRKVASFTCSKCKIQRYCSRDCQVKHWPTHKANCFYVKPEFKRKEWDSDGFDCNKLSIKGGGGGGGGESSSKFNVGDEIASLVNILYDENHTSLEHLGDTYPYL
jgi:hypothetical protein